MFQNQPSTLIFSSFVRSIFNIFISEIFSTPRIQNPLRLNQTTSPRPAVHSAISAFL